ncbi:MAG: nucleoside phosphorylase [Anaerolineae bacterium]|nr:nucleoside phosphorylase [Anaerolineae bacterium]
MMSNETLYLKCKPDDIAPLVLISGDPARVARVAALLNGVSPVKQNREFAVATGAYNGVPVTVASGGIGAPSTAIAIHELVQLGAKAIVRIGTMMGVGAPMQSVMIPTGAVRYEGTSARYLPLAFPAVPDERLSRALAEAGQKRDLDVRRGLTATYDAFYPDMAPSLVSDETLDLTALQRARVLTMDMESALVFVLGTVLGIAAASMCLVTVQAEPYRHLDADIRAELDDRTVRAAVDGLVAFGSQE